MFKKQKKERESKQEQSGRTVGDHADFFSAFCSILNVLLLNLVLRRKANSCSSRSIREYRRVMYFGYLPSFLLLISVFLLQFLSS